MNYQLWNFGGKGSWNENLWKGLKVEISIKNVYRFVNLCVVEKSEQVKLYL